MTSLANLMRFFQKRKDLDYKPLPETAEREQKALDEQAAEALRRMRSSGQID